MEKTRESLLNRDTLVICAAGFLGDVNWGIINPIYTLYALNLGADFTFIGAMASVQSLIFILFSLPFGAFSDRKGRRLLLLLSRLIWVLVNIFYVLVGSYLHLLPIRILLGLGMVCDAVALRSYIADVAGPSRFQEMTGLYMVSMGLGVIAGPLIGGWIAGIWGYRLTYFFATLVPLANLLLVSFGVRGGDVTRMQDGVKKGEVTTNTIEKPRLMESLKIILKSRAIMSVITLSSINALIYNSLFDYFPAYARGIEFNAIAIGSLFTVRGVFTTLTRFPSTVVGKKIGHRKMMILSILPATVALLLVPLSTDFVFQVMLMAVQGASYGAFLASYMIYLFGRADESRRGVTLAVDAVVINSLSGVYGPLRGAAADILGIDGAFPFIASVCFFGTAISILMGRKTDYRAHSLCQ